MKPLNNFRQISPQKPSPAALGAFWLVLFMLPLLCMRVGFRYYADATYERHFNEDARLLDNELVNFKNDLRLEKVIAARLKDAQPELASLLDSTQEEAELQRFLDEVKQLLLQKFSLPVALSAVISEKSGKFAAHGSERLNAGQRPLRIILGSLGVAAENLDTTQLKRFEQMQRAVFGPLSELPDQPEVLKTSFLNKNGSDKLFSMFMFLRAHDKTRVKLFLAFAENDFSAKTLLQGAINNSSPGTTRELRLLPTIPERPLLRQKNHLLSLAEVAEPEFLRIGSHKGQSWFSQAIRAGFADRRTGKLPHLVVSRLSGKNRAGLESFVNWSGLLMLIAGFWGLFLLKQVQAGVYPGNNVPQRFRLAILFTVIFPFVFFILASLSFSESFNDAYLRSALQKMENRLQELEISLLGVERQNREQIHRKVAVLKGIRGERPSVIRDFLDTDMHRLYFGYSFLRNDGTMLERLPERSLVGKEDYKKFTIARELLFAQIINLFETAKVISAEGYEKFEKLPGYKSWRAYIPHLAVRDLNSFLKQDGSFYPTRQADSSHFLLSTHNLFPDEAEEKNWASLILFSSTRGNVEKFLNEKLAEPGFFLGRLDEENLSCTVFRCLDDSMRLLDRQIAWPQEALKDRELLEAVYRVDAVRQNISWYTAQPDGVINLFAVKAIPQNLAVLVARSQISTAGQRSSLLLIVILLLCLYSMAIVFLVGRVLAWELINPLNLLLVGIEELNQSCYPQIVNKGTNEFSRLINQFNLLVKSLRQRKLLDRFISDELAETIALEGQTGRESEAEPVYRVVMFMNIRSFSQICDSIAPEATIRLLNLYFSALEPEIIRQGGQIDKYIGDAVMVSFSAEKCDGEPECRAFAAAEHCRKAVLDLKSKFAAENLPGVVPCIGLAAGRVIRGRIGDRKHRQDFTLIGDTVNLAARLEAQANKMVGAQILVSQTVFEKIKSKFEVKFLSEIQVKGKMETVKVYQAPVILDDADE